MHVLSASRSLPHLRCEAHRRAGREDQALSSERTSARASSLVTALWSGLPELRDAFDALSTAVDSEFLVEAAPAPVAVPTKAEEEAYRS